MTTPFDGASPAWSVRLISELNAADERATALASPLSQRQLNWTPVPGVWSVGQCLAHLCLANEVYVAAMSSALVDRKPAPVQNITTGWFGRWFIRNYVEDSPEPRPKRAPRKILPGTQVEPSILDRFLRSNDRARELIHRARNHDVNRIRFTNPFISVIRFTVGTGLEILSKHQRRHLLQAERIRESPGFPDRNSSGR